MAASAEIDEAGSAKLVELKSEGEFKRIYEAKTWLGRGSFGTVDLVTHIQTGKEYAAKSIIKRDVDLDQIAEEFMILRKLRHKHVACLYAAYETPYQVILITDFCNGGELMGSLAMQESHAMSSGYSERTVRGHVRGIVEGVAYLHSVGVAHRDLKPENVMLHREAGGSVVKLIDFGLARGVEYDQLMETVCGTHAYLAPEVILNDRGVQAGYDTKVDIWGVGVITYILLFGNNPFRRKSKRETHDAVLSADVPYPNSNVSVAGVNFTTSMLGRVGPQRPSAEQLLQHTWLTCSETDLDFDVELCSSLGPNCEVTNANQPVHKKLHEWHAGRKLGALMDKMKIGKKKGKKDEKPPGFEVATERGPPPLAVSDLGTEEEDPLNAAVARKPR